MTLIRIAVGVAAASAVALTSATANAYPMFPCPNPDDQDRMFVRMLEHDGTLFSFNLEAMQAKRACDMEAYSVNAQQDLAIVNDLMVQGGYGFDVANSIVSAGNVAYCPRNLHTEWSVAQDRPEQHAWPQSECDPGETRTQV